MVNIFLIYAPNCKHCKQMEASVESAIKRSEITCEFKKIIYTSKTAINLAIKNGIKDLPGLIVGTKSGVFYGDNYNEDKILNAIKKASQTCKPKKQNP